MLTTDDIEIYKKNPNDIITWGRVKGYYGGFNFTFDGKKWFNYYQDFPDNLTPKQRKIFERENPYLAEIRTAEPDNKWGVTIKCK